MSVCISVCLRRLRDSWPPKIQKNMLGLKSVSERADQFGINFFYFNFGTVLTPPLGLLHLDPQNPKKHVGFKIRFRTC